MSLKGSKTIKNLQKAFEITSKRRMEYDIYALVAQKQGYEDVSHLFARFAEHEKEHSKLWYKWLKINKGTFPSLITCVKNALSQEKEEIEGLYEAFAKDAKEEGFDHIAGLLENLIAMVLTIGLAVHVVLYLFKKMNRNIALYV